MQGAFARQQLRDKQEQAQGALVSTNTKNAENQLREANNEAANHNGQQSKIETVLRKGTQDNDDNDAEDKDDVDGTRRRRGRRGRRRRGRGRRRRRRGGRRRRGRRGGRRRRNRRRG
ncbi:PREDICTED: protamine-like [Bactrocera latifrons]|nr:PREDICTED: protamine-like [Bactrocera latifrons]